MANIKLGATVVGIRGTIDGITYSANKSGPYAKGWARSSNPRTSLQAAQRNRIANWSNYWKTLSSANKTAWDAYAADPAQELTNSLGEPYFISGFNWFVALSTNLQQAGESVIDTAPLLGTPTAPLLTSYTLNSTGAGADTRVGFNAASPTLTMKKALLQSMANTAGRSVAPADPTLMRIVAPSGVQISFQPQTEAAFGTISDGQKGFIFVYNQNAEGRRSTVVTRNDIAEPH